MTNSASLYFLAVTEVTTVTRSIDAAISETVAKVILVTAVTCNRCNHFWKGSGFRNSQCLCGCYRVTHVTFKNHRG
jgi:hypothetical protein